MSYHNVVNDMVITIKKLQTVVKVPNNASERIAYQCTPAAKALRKSGNQHDANAVNRASEVKFQCLIISISAK